MSYPQSPGYKREGTAEEAASSMADEQKSLLNAVQLALSAYGPQTADEVASALKRDRLAIRPRLTELQRLGLVVDSGDRRKNESGRRAIVWELTGPAIQMTFL